MGYGAVELTVSLLFIESLFLDVYLKSFGAIELFPNENEDSCYLVFNAFI
jgi:hypothetical protein